VRRLEEGLRGEELAVAEDVLRRADDRRMLRELARPRIAQMRIGLGRRIAGELRVLFGVVTGENANRKNNAVALIGARRWPLAPLRGERVARSAG
jgi:hypothetical protein